MTFICSSLMRLFPLIVLLGLMLFLAGCSGDKGTSSDNDLSDVNVYLGDLPSWESFASVNDTADIPVGDIVADMSNMVMCTTTPCSITQNPEEIVTFGSAPNVLYLGSLIQGNTYMGGLGTMEELPIRQRAPLTIAVNLSTGTDITDVVENPNGATVQASLNTIISDAADSWQESWANIFYQKTETYSLKQASLRLGVSFKYMGTSAQAQLAYSATNEQHTITAYFKQVMYEAYIVPPQTPAEFFSTSFTNEKLQEQVNLGNIGSNNLPVYVGKIQYGRMMMFTMTSSAHTDSMKMAIEGSYSGFTQYSVEVQASLRNILQSSEYTIISIGGPASTVLDMIKSGNLNDYFKTDASLTTAVPLAYTLYNLADGSIATVSETTEYDVRECSALNAQCYLNKTEWQMAIAELVGEGHIIEFPTTPENVALANEVASLPNENDILGTILTFDSASTQLPFTFSLKPGVSGYRLQYKADRWISVGLVGVEEDDVFDIRIPEWNDNAAVFAIGIDIGDNWREPDEEGLYVYGVDGFEKRFLGVAPNHPETFLGVVATVPLTTFHFNEGDVNDDIFVRDFYFGVLEWSD